MARHQSQLRISSLPWVSIIASLVTLLLVLVASTTPASANATFTTQVTASPTSVEQGGSVTVTVVLNNTTSKRVITNVVLDVKDPSGGLVNSKTWTKRNVGANSTTTLSSSFIIGSNAAIGTYSATVTTMAGATGPTPVFDVITRTSASVIYNNLDNDDVSKWERYVEGPTGFRIDDFAQRITDESAPSGDKTVFHMGINSSSSYANVYRYQRKPLANATEYTYKVRFKWSSGTGPAPQALEFPFSIYTGSKRLEAAMQWVSGHDGQGARWRVWSGFNADHWTDLDPNGNPWGFYQTLEPDVWHTFSLKVTILKDLLQDEIIYHSFTVNGVTRDINAKYDGFGDTTTAQTVIAYQIDNNYWGNRQDVWLDDFTLEATN